jgi:hypothetical protein
MGQRQPTAQRTETSADNPGRCAELFERQVLFASFDSPDVTPINIGFKSKVLLGKPFSFPRGPNSFAEHLE